MGGAGEEGRHLSRHDLLCLLSILEGELQAKDEVITVLKAENMEPASLEAHYGFATPEEALRALQRDSLRPQACKAQQARRQDVYERPMMELERVAGAHRRASRRMLQLLLEVERSHSSALCRLEDQERKHRTFIQRSDEFTCLLEQERERLKQQLSQKSQGERREGESQQEELSQKSKGERREGESQQEELSQKSQGERREGESQQEELSTLQDDLGTLQPSTHLVVNEQQRLTNQLTDQRQNVQQLTGVADHAQREPDSAHSRAREEEVNAQHLEAELSDLRRNEEAMTAKLANKDAQNQQLRQRLATLSRQVDELERMRGDLRRAEEELRELRDRVAGGGGEDGGEPASLGLLSEVEQLRRRVVEMEGKDVDVVRLGDQCRDLDRRLTHASIQGRSLKAEVEKLNGRISELDRLEETLGRSRQECSSLRSSLEKERAATKQLSGELEVLRIRVRELEAIEGPLERAEGRLRQDLTKLRTLTMVLVEDRKTLAQRLQQAEQKLQQEAEGRRQEVNNKDSLAGEKLVEERQKEPTSRAQLEERCRSVEKERDELGSRLRTEEERNRDLQSKANIMRRRIEALERKDGGRERRKGKDEETNKERRQEDDDNKVRELSEEVESLRRRLTQKKVVEEELMKAEEEYEALERRCNEEQERSRALGEKLKEARTELARYQLAEKKQEEPNQEHLLLRRLQEEQVRSRLLSREVEALKENVQRLMGTEESISQVQMDHATLQRRLAQQEVKNRELAREMEGLTQELERYRHFSKSLRPGMNGRRFADLHQSTKEVQTEAEEPQRLPPHYQNLAPTVLNGKLQGDDEKDLNHNEEQVETQNIPPPVNLNNLNMQNNNLRRSSIPLANRKVPPHGNSEVQNSNLVRKGDLVLTHNPGQPLHIKVTPDHSLNPGQPLHIKVTPDHSLNTATLEISSPTGENAASYTSTALIPTTGASPKQRITIIQNSSMSPPKAAAPSSPSSPDEVGSLDRAFSPLTLTPLSRVATPNSLRSHTPDSSSSPAQILTVSTGSSDPTEVVGQTVFRVTPERPSNGWQLHKSSNAGSSVITTDDNKIHIHLGSPYIQALNGITHVATQPGRQYHSPGQEAEGARTQTLPNGCHVKSSSKITSSITISPANSPALQPSHITIPREAFRKGGPTQIPKPKVYGALKGTNRASNTAPSQGTQSNNLHTGKQASLRVQNRTNITKTTC